jgi:hypothetical protein
VTTGKQVLQDNIMICESNINSRKSRELTANNFRLRISTLKEKRTSESILPTSYAFLYPLSLDHGRQTGEAKLVESKLKIQRTSWSEKCELDVDERIQLIIKKQRVIC